MRRQLQLDGLRRQDPKTLEVLVADALRLPILQLSPGTLADLLALSELTTLPAPLKRDLDGFAWRIGQQIADLPDGPVLDEFLTGLDGLDPALVPVVLRGYVAREAAREPRLAQGRERMTALAASWVGTPRAVVELATKAPRILRAEARPPVDEPIHRKAARPASERPPAPARLPRVRTNEDVEREQWLQKHILDKLADYTSAGLREEVLVAGVRHAAKATYPDLGPPEIVKVLKGLADTGRLKRSAGRWARTDRIW